MKQILLEILVAVAGGVIVWWLTQASEAPPLPPVAFQPTNWPFSPNSQYRATQVGDDKNLHYQIKEVKTGRILLTTQAQYNTSNDVKVGVFSQVAK